MGFDLFGGIDSSTSELQKIFVFSATCIVNL